MLVVRKTNSFFEDLHPLLTSPLSLRCGELLDEGAITITCAFGWDLLSLEIERIDLFFFFNRGVNFESFQ